MRWHVHSANNFGLMNDFWVGFWFVLWPTVMCVVIVYTTIWRAGRGRDWASLEWASLEYVLSPLSLHVARHVIWDIVHPD